MLGSCFMRFLSGARGAPLSLVAAVALPPVAGIPPLLPAPAALRCAVLPAALEEVDVEPAMVMIKMAVEDMSWRS